MNQGISEIRDRVLSMANNEEKKIDEFFKLRRMISEVRISYD